jgi:hypothetical protein
MIELYMGLLLIFVGFLPKFISTGNFFYETVSALCHKHMAWQVVFTYIGNMYLVGSKSISLSNCLYSSLIYASN